MDFSLLPEEAAFQNEVRRFIEREINAELVAEVEGGHNRGPQVKAFARKLGARGWLLPMLPREYGGIGGTFVQRFILADELEYYRAMPVLPELANVGPCLMMFGTEQQKQEYLLGIARGETYFALGYTEANAGSDIAALELRAVEDGDDYVLNGGKLFSSYAHCSDFHLVATRTNPDVPKAKGISLFIVDLRSLGISISPVYLMTGARNNIVYYDNVRVPRQNLVGQRDRGFYHMMDSLVYERTFPTGEIRRVFEELLDFAKANVGPNGPLALDPLIRQKLGEMATDLEVLRLLSFQVAWMFGRKLIPATEGAALKVYMTETLARLADVGVDVLGLYAQLKPGSRLAPIEGRIQRLALDGYRRPITAGSNEIQRNIIAQRGLGLPR